MALTDVIKQETANLKEQAPAQEVDENQLTDEEETDLKIAVNMMEDIIDQGGIEVIDQALDTSSDPGQVIGQFLLQAGDEIISNMPEQVPLSPRIWLSEGGVLEQVSDYLQEEYDVPREVMDRAEIYVASTLQQMSGAEGQAPQPGQQAEPLPQETGAPAPQQPGVV